MGRVPAQNPSTASSLPASAAVHDAGRAAKTAAYYIGFVALGLSGASLGPTLPGLAEHTGTTLSQISAVFAAGSFGYLLGSFASGRYYDRLPGHRLLAFGLASMAALMVLVPVTSLLPVLAAVLLLRGAAEGLLDVGTNTLIVWLYREKVGPYMNGLHFFFGLGALLSPLVVAGLTQSSGDITLAYWALAALMIPPAVIVLRLASPAILAPARRAEAQPDRVSRALTALIMVFFFLYVGSEVGYGGWVFTLARSRGLDAGQAAYVNSAFWGALTLGRLLSIPLAARYSSRAILSVDLAGAVLSASILLMWGESQPALWIGTLGLGLSIASIFPTMLSYAGTRMAVTGRVTGLFVAASSAGAMAMPWLMGQLVEPVGAYAVVAGVLASLALSAAVFVVIDRSGAFPKRGK